MLVGKSPAAKALAVGVRRDPEVLGHEGGRLATLDSALAIACTLPCGTNR
jgi:hypothetical protein